MLSSSSSTAMADSASSSVSSFPNSTSPATFVACPSPLVLADDGMGIAGTGCTTPYRSLLWSASDWQQGDHLMLGFTTVSFASLCLILTTWTLFPSKRRQHHLHMFLLCQFMIALVFLSSLISTSNRPSAIGLPSFDATDPSPSSPLCLYQASLLIFFVNAGVFWWTFIAFHLFIKVVLHIRLTSSQQNISTLAYHATSWLVSAVLTLVGGVNGWLGRSSVVPWCFFRDDAPAAADWLLFYLPIGARGAVGMLMMVVVMWRLSRQSALTASMRRRAGGCARNVRPLLFIFQFLVIFFFLILFRAVLHFNQTQYEDAVADFVVCLLTQANCGDKPVNSAPLVLFVLIIAVTAGQGIVPGLIYLSQAGTLELWKGLLTGQGLGGTSRTGRGESSVNTASRVGGLSANTAVRRMSGREAGDSRGKGKVTGARKGSRPSIPPPLPPSLSHTLPLPSPTLTSHVPRASLSHIETTYAGPRMSQSSEQPTPSPGAGVGGGDVGGVQRWYEGEVWGVGRGGVEMVEVGGREAGEGVGRVGRVEWTGQVRGEALAGMSSSACLGDGQGEERELDVAEGGRVQVWNTGSVLGLEGVGVGLGVDVEEKEEEDYRVALPQDD